MDEFNWILFVFLMISTAEFSWQIVISELSSWILGAMRLTLPYNRKLEVLCSKKFWTSLFGYAWFIATPIILIFNTHKYLAHLFSCPFCCATWIALAVNVFILKLTILSAITLMPIALVFVALLNLLHSK